MQQTYLPLSEVGDIREQILTFGENLANPDKDSTTVIVDCSSLGLPVGLDLERVGVSLPRLTRASKFIGSTLLLVNGYNGDSDTTTITGNVNSDGSLTSARVSTESAQKNDPFLQTIDSNLFSISMQTRMNNNSRNDSFKEIADRYETGLQAKSLNKAIKMSLLQLNTTRNLHTGSSTDAFFDGIRAGLAPLAFYETITDPNVFNSIISGLWLSGFALRIGGTRIKANYTGLQPHYSYFEKFKLERYIRAKTYIKSAKFVTNLSKQ